MKKFWYFPFLFAGLIGLIASGTSGISQAQTAMTGSQQGISLEVGASPIRQNVSRLGLNLGPWTSWGAGQFGKNLIQNPGFEGTINQIVVFVNQSDATSFCDDVNQVYPNGLWNGASWLVRTGPSKGARGTVTRSVGKGSTGFPQYFADSIPPLNVGDVIILTKVTNGSLQDFWWTSSTDTPKMSFDTSTYRPGSGGVQSLKMSPTGPGNAAEMDYAIDSITSRSGKLLNLSGSWTFSIWAKSDGVGTLSVIFQRYGSSLFLNQTITPTQDWQEYQFQFNVADTGPPNGVGLKIVANNGTVWVDDINLSPVQPQNVTAFRQEVIDVLNTIRPSFLRSAPDLSNTFANRIADPYARKYATERANGEQLGHPHYDFSFDEFLLLCQTVDANPWLIIPVTWSDEEYTQFGQYLALKAGIDKFAEVIVEFGNENWNLGFRPLAFSGNYTAQHGLVATHAFDLIKTAAQGAANIKTAVNGQTAWPTLSYQYYDSTPTADIYTPASYFYDAFDRGTTNDMILRELFAPDPALSQQISAIKQRGKQAAIYEYNLNTSGGTAIDAERTPVLAGAIGGVALAKRTIDLINMGYDPAVVYCLTQYDIYSSTGFAKIFGITVSLGAPTVYRPTGLVVTMLNRVIAGDLYGISVLSTPSQVTDNLTMAAFKASDMWTAAFTSQNSSPQTINLQFPDDGHPLPQKYTVLQFNTMFDMNETSQTVTTVSNSLPANGRVVTFTIPAYGCVVIGESQDFLKRYTPNASTTTRPETTPTIDSTPAPAPSPIPEQQPVFTPETPTTTAPTTTTPTEVPTPSSAPSSTSVQQTEPTPAAEPVTTPKKRRSTVDKLRKRAKKLQQQQADILNQLNQTVNGLSA